jgi:hypothetical protein
MQLSAKVHFRRPPRPEESSFCLLLGRDEADLPATPADVGVLPVPVESGIDLAIVAGDLAKTNSHAQERSDGEEQEHGDCISTQRSRCWMFKD